MAKFNTQTTAGILAAVRLGSSLDLAGLAVGVSRTTIWRWLKQGEADEVAGKRTNHAKFYRDLNQAGAEVVSRVEQNVVSMSATDPRAAIWFLSKRKPDVYSNRDDAEREAMKKQMAEELFYFAKRYLSPAAFDELASALARFGDEQLDPQALPAPG